LRLVPIDALKSGEILASSITNANNQILMKEGATLTPKMINRIRVYGIHSIYIQDPEMNQFLKGDVKTNIRPFTRNNSVKKVKTSFEKFEYQLERQKKNLRYGDSGCELLQNVKVISNDLIDEILESSNTEISMIDIKSINDYQYSHSVSVSVLSLIIGTELGLSIKELEDLAYGALLIDIGCKWIDPDLLSSDGKISNQEMENIRDHVNVGYEYITNNTSFNAHVKSIIMHHHERIDGSGYPKGLKGDEIHPLAKIVMIADVYDALTSDRPYRKAYNQHEAIEYILAHASSKFDFEIAQIFARKVIPFPVGTYVLLTNNQKGVVTENNLNHPLRPNLRVFGKSKYTNENSVQINLLNNNNVTIAKIIHSLT